MNYQQDTSSQQGNIDIMVLFNILWEHRKVFYWVLAITFVVSVALILCVPRYYTCDVILAPEAQAGNSSSSIQALASSFGFDMRNMSNSDALYPMIYPEIVKSPNFLVTLFDIHVRTAEDDFEGTYFQYIQNKHKHVFWKRWKSKIKRWLTPPEPEVQLAPKEGGGVDVFCMSKGQWSVIRLMQDNIKCDIDKKTEMITFSVTAQDKLVCATIADSVCAALQAFVTDYRTQKARTDIQYYEEVMIDAYNEYQIASEKYIRYIDSHSGMNLELYRHEAKNLETELHIKQAAYTSFQKQYLATQARLQENTPVFTVLQSASVPLKPAGPRRALFVLAMLFLATIATSCVICKDMLIETFL